jgi:hypothetical protein
MEHFLEQHSGEMTILFMGMLVALTLLILVPQLLKSQQNALQMRHTEAMRALEQGLLLPNTDDNIRFAGRTAALVPMVVVCAAGIVTCFLAAYRSESLFAVTLTVWSVAGVVSLAAITGGVALMGRLAGLKSGEEEDVPEESLQKR